MQRFFIKNFLYIERKWKLKIRFHFEKKTRKFSSTNGKKVDGKKWDGAPWKCVHVLWHAYTRIPKNGMRRDCEQIPGG